jgi:hypothetical protein
LFDYGKEDGLKRALGSEHFVQMVEKGLGRMFRPQKPGPKKKYG